jgi:magnesium-protoporphyrin IX monomethyl ester (oxidative) cyclase
MTPYPGTEIWHTTARNLTTLDYRLFDIQHAVLPTTLPLDVFYAELVKTQAVINRKHLGLSTLLQVSGIASRLLLHGQTNFIRMLWRFNRVYNGTRQLADHQRPPLHKLPQPGALKPPGRRDLYVHASPRRRPAGHRAPLAE